MKEIDSSKLTTATLQSAFLKGFSNFLAQLLTTEHGLVSGLLLIDWIAVFHYALFNLLTSPLNFCWQQFLEEAFPTSTTPTTPTTTTKKATQTLPERVKNEADFQNGHVDGRKLSSAKAEKEQQPAVESPRTTRTTAFLSNLNVKNLALKLLCDQLFGAAFFNASFIALMTVLRSNARSVVKTVPRHRAVINALQERFWPIMLANWCFWPLVALVNFIFIPVHQRVVFISLAGVGWGLYLSLRAGI